MTAAKGGTLRVRCVTMPARVEVTSRDGRRLRFEPERGTCRDGGAHVGWRLFECSRCGVVFPVGAMRAAPELDRTLPPKYCPNCGRKVVNE